MQPPFPGYQSVLRKYDVLQIELIYYQQYFRADKTRKKF